MVTNVNNKYVGTNIIITLQKQNMNGMRSGVALSSHIWSLVSTYEMFTLTAVTMTMWLIEGALYISIPLEAESYQ